MKIKNGLVKKNKLVKISLGLLLVYSFLLIIRFTAYLEFFGEKNAGILDWSSMVYASDGGGDGGGDGGDGGGDGGGGAGSAGPHGCDNYTPDYSCAADTCAGSLCSDGCFDVVPGTKTDGACCIPNFTSADCGNLCGSAVNSCGDTVTCSCSGSDTCVNYYCTAPTAPTCSPSCSAVCAFTCAGTECGDDGCGASCYGTRTLGCCVPTNPGCATNTCRGETCNNGCIDIPGTKNCVCKPSFTQANCSLSACGSYPDGCYGPNVNCTCPQGQNCINGTCQLGCECTNSNAFSGGSYPPCPSGETCADNCFCSRCIPTDSNCAANTYAGSSCWDGCEWIPGAKPSGCSPICGSVSCIDSCGGNTCCPYYPPEYVGCNQYCNEYDYICKSGLICYPRLVQNGDTGVCRLPNDPTDSTCTATTDWSVSLSANPDYGNTPLVSNLTVQINNAYAGENYMPVPHCGAGMVAPENVSSSGFTCTYTSAGIYNPRIMMIAQKTGISKNDHTTVTAITCTPDCSNADNVCKDEPYTSLNNCGQCTGTKEGSCLHDIADVCDGLCGKQSNLPGCHEECSGDLKCASDAWCNEKTDCGPCNSGTWKEVAP